MMRSQLLPGTPTQDSRPRPRRPWRREALRIVLTLLAVAIVLVALTIQ